MSSIAAASSVEQPPAQALAQDLRTISVVSLAHGVSHFFHMLLPPLFPAFIRDFGLNYSELGLLVSVFFVVSSIGQALAGFVVDRFGARPVLQVALVCFVVAALAGASAQGYGGLLVASALAGLGNSPFHPVDFTILNQRVSHARLGHAFSAHGISGNLGWALAPVFMIGLAEATGTWRAGLVGAALLAVAVLVLVLLNRASLADRPSQGARAVKPGAGGSASAAAAAAAASEHPLAFLKLPALWLCFVFFLFSTAALSAIQGFASPALQRLYGLPLGATAFIVTGYMVFAAVGMVLGGFLTTRVQRLELIIGVAMCVSAALLLLVALGVLPGTVAALVAAAAGFGTGMAGPSRDMLIKQAAPPGATGRVYGTVYAGVDVGFALGAPVFGALMDHGTPSGVFYGAALMLLLGVALAAGVAQRIRHDQGQRAQAAPAPV